MSPQIYTLRGSSQKTYCHWWVHTLYIAFLKQNLSGLGAKFAYFSLRNQITVHKHCYLPIQVATGHWAELCGAKITGRNPFDYLQEGSMAGHLLDPKFWCAPRVTKNPAMYAALANCVQYSLENFLYDNATFMAERIWAEDKSELSRHLLATCYFSSQKYHAAYDVLIGSTSERNKYLLALSAFRLGKLKEAEYALTEGRQTITNIAIPNNAVGLHLLGTICRLVVGVILLIIQKTKSERESGLLL